MLLPLKTGDGDLLLIKEPGFSDEMRMHIICISPSPTWGGGGVIAVLPALIHARLHSEFLPRTEPYRQSKLYANCQSSLTIVVLTEKQ